MSYQLQQNALLPLVARTVVLNFGLNEGKQIFARNTRNPNSDEASKIIRTLCAIKTMLTWHTEHTSRICRERTGGAGILERNLIGEAIAGSHAGMTAEGDNKVLM
jgi:acyl-CoA oxidase